MFLDPRSRDRLYFPRRDERLAVQLRHFNRVRHRTLILTLVELLLRAKQQFLFLHRRIGRRRHFADRQLFNVAAVRANLRNLLTVETHARLHFMLCLLEHLSSQPASFGFFFLFDFVLLLLVIDFLLCQVLQERCVAIAVILLHHFLLLLFVVRCLHYRLRNYLVGYGLLDQVRLQLLLRYNLLVLLRWLFA